MALVLGHEDRERRPRESLRLAHPPCLFCGTYRSVLTIPYVTGEDGRSPAVNARMLVEIDGRRRPIESVYEEGFRKKLHILITLSDLDYDGGY